MEDLVKKPKLDAKAKSVIAVVVMFGIISCFGDVIYEGGRSANGQYFNLLSISATKVGIIYGIGEFLGYALRLLSGRISDKTGKHWVLIFIGYGTLCVVPLMGLTTNWTILCALVLLERIGKALRNPPKDTILSQVAENHVGTGFVFGLQEALDQLGAFAGPLVFTFVFLLSGKNDAAAYQLGYKILIVAFALVMGSVYVAYRRVSRYNLTREGESIERGSDKLTSVFWIYCVFAFLSTFGFVAFSIIGYHLKDKGVMPDSQITLMYSIAMIVDAIMAMIIGRIYDVIKKKRNNKKAGLLTLIFIPFATLAMPFLTLSEDRWLVVAGFVMFGIIMGAHETIMRSAIADITSFRKRGTAYGIFNCAYGLAFLAGSSLMGWMYDHMSILSIGILVIAIEAAALGVFFVMRRSINKVDAPQAPAPQA
ncbi:MAG TPA: MFS transporter [Clostridia bacterium]|nr:MFS transporter [Clostridia bacterium]HPK16445.1 MFS transporter [Clostridia bacterium]